MALVWPRGRSNRDFGPFSTVFRSPRFSPLKNVPEFRICSYRSENTRFRVSHSPPDGARMRDPRIFTPGSVLYKSCGSRVSVREAHADFCFGPPAEQSRLCIAHSVEVTADEVDYFLFFHLFISSYCLGKRIDFRSVEFLVFSPSRIYRSRRHSSGAALPRPTGQFQIL
jgi:hypothetical protein